AVFVLPTTMRYSRALLVAGRLMPFGMSVELSTLTSPTAMLLMSLGWVLGPAPPSPPPHAATIRSNPAGESLLITLMSSREFADEQVRINTRSAKKGARASVRQ